MPRFLKTEICREANFWDEKEHLFHNAFAYQKRKQRMCGRLRLKSRGMLGINQKTNYHQLMRLTCVKCWGGEGCQTRNPPFPFLTKEQSQRNKIRGKIGDEECPGQRHKRQDLPFVLRLCNRTR